MRRDDETAGRLAEAIATSGLTNAELSRRTGIHANSLREYRERRGLPSLPHFTTICQELGLCADVVLGLRPEPTGILIDDARFRDLAEASPVELAERLRRDGPVLWPFFAEVRPNMRPGTAQEIVEKSRALELRLEEVAPRIARAWGSLLLAFDRARYGRRGRSP